MQFAAGGRRGVRRAPVTRDRRLDKQNGRCKDVAGCQWQVDREEWVTLAMLGSRLQNLEGGWAG